jgi:hypothetical protein
MGNLWALPAHAAEHERTTTLQRNLRARNRTCSLYAGVIILWRHVHAQPAPRAHPAELLCRLAQIQPRCRASVKPGVRTVAVRDLQSTTVHTVVSLQGHDSALHVHPTRPQLCTRQGRHRQAQCAAMIWHWCDGGICLQRACLRGLAVLCWLSSMLHHRQAVIHHCEASRSGLHLSG